MTVDTFQTLTALRPGSHLIRLRRPRWVCLGEAHLSEPRRAPVCAFPLAQVNAILSATRHRRV